MAQNSLRCKIQSLIVQKYGGSSVSTPDQIRKAARKIAELKTKGHQVIVVISAMGKTTDQLSQLAYSVSPTPVRRELDMLLSTGERVASALMSMALNDVGVEAISFTGSQAGILTDDSHTNAQIVDLKPIRVEDEISKGKTVVIAGFQGVSPRTKEITTLGRGGTDLSAVALAHHFGADQCEILKEVDGVFSADPLIVSQAKHIPKLDFSLLKEMPFWGAKMLHYRAAELAARKNVRLRIGLASGDGKGTVVSGEESMLEEKKVLSVNSHNKIVKLTIEAKSQGEAYKLLESHLTQTKLPWPQILDSTLSESGCRVLLTAPSETLQAFFNLGKSVPQFHFESSELSSVTATCCGLVGTDLISVLTTGLETSGVKAQHVLLSPLSVTYIVRTEDREKTIASLHRFV